MTMARNWRDIRAEAIAQGRLDPARAVAARKEMHDAVQAHQLAEIRKAQGHARQSDVAALMGVSQVRVSKLESGDLSHTELGTLRSYVAALGGQVRVVADFGESSVELTA
ncbi:XRE family transcriptional regulator [Mycobacterium sp.]|uniref:XRE family transcriptional regulator n=1 Tax=Mycobacterium sp. TaxID=1785 RepID=UPI003C754CE3